MDILSSALISFLITGILKARTRLNGTNWLILVNVIVSLLYALCNVWLNGNAAGVSDTLKISVDAFVSALLAHITHKMVKDGYQ